MKYLGGDTVEFYFINRETVIKQTTQNMVEAGVIEPDDAELFVNELQQLDPKDLLTVLLESHGLREQAAESIEYYPIGDISLN